MCTCNCDPDGTVTRKRGGIVRLLLDLAMVYVLLVFGGGTLIQTGHPVAVEAGRLMQTVTLVDPAIAWADNGGHDAVARGLGMLARGIG